MGESYRAGDEGLLFQGCIGILEGKSICVEPLGWDKRHGQAGPLHQSPRRLQGTF